MDSDSPVEDYVNRILPQKLTLDRLYSRTASLGLDLRILYWTFVTVVLRHPVSVNRVTAAMNLRRRPRPRPLPPAPAAATLAAPAAPESAVPVEAQG